MILSDVDIQQYMQSGDIVIDNYSGQLEPASYDLRVGPEGVLEDGSKDIRTLEYLKIPRGATVVVYSLERLRLSTKIAGRFGLRSHFARQGLIPLFGPQIDPGFEGRLSMTMFNAGTSEIVLKYEERIASVEFFPLKTTASRAYSGPYQSQEKISGEEFAIVTRKYRNFAETEDAITKAQADVEHIKNFMYLVFWGLVVGATLAVLQHFLK